MNQHKDLPTGSQSWAKEVDAVMEENKHLKEVVRRLCENAGLDYSNPQRGLSSGGAPSTNNPVGQKLSSLADVQIYNVADEQVLSWSQQGQRWMPVTLPTPSAGGTIDISGVSYSGLAEGYGQISEDATQYAYTAGGVLDGYSYTEVWGRNYVYIGAGDYQATTGFLGFIEVNEGNAVLNAQDLSTGVETRFATSPGAFVFTNGYVRLPRYFTSTRPTPSSSKRGAIIFDMDLNIPIVCNGTGWTNALGTAV